MKDRGERYLDCPARERVKPARQSIAGVFVYPVQLYSEHGEQRQGGCGGEGEGRPAQDIREQTVSAPAHYPAVVAYADDHEQKRRGDEAVQQGAQIERSDRVDPRQIDQCPDCH